MFGLNYRREGPGISKDAPKKEGFALFMDILSREFWTVVMLNIFFVITCIPIITIGPSICALNYVCAKMIRDEPVDIFPDYKRGFMINCSQGIVVGTIVAFMSILLFYAWFYYHAMGSFLSYVIIGLSCIFGMFNVHIFLLTSTISLPTFAVFKNSIFITVLTLKKTISSFAINLIITIVNLGIFPVCIWYYLFFGFSFLAFLNAFFAYPSMEKYATGAVTFDEDDEYEDFEDDENDNDNRENFSLELENKINEDN